MTAPAPRPLVLPVLAYADPDAAVEWLCRVFRFSEASRIAGPDGRVIFADLRTASGGALMVGGIRPPVGAGEVRMVDAMTVLVEDVDEQFLHVRREGASVVSEPADQPWGLRDFEVLDLEGRRWNFSQHLADVSPADWGAS